MHLGTKVDYLFFQISGLLQATERQLLQNQCEQERTQILTNLMLALENPRLADYMVTGNRSMFLETDGCVAWLNHCPKVHSPLHTMNECYDKVPILYRGKIQFVEPITRQTYPHATTQKSSDRIKNLFQTGMDQEDSWYTLMPGIVHHDKPAIFGPQDNNPVDSHTFTGSQDAGMYTRTLAMSLKDFGIASSSMPPRDRLLKISHKIFCLHNRPRRTDCSYYYNPRTKFFVDKMISAGYFKDQFLDTFGPVVYILEHCGIYFPVFLFIKLIIDVVVMVVRYMELDKFTGSTLGFGKTLLSA